MVLRIAANAGIQLSKKFFSSQGSQKKSCDRALEWTQKMLKKLGAEIEVTQQQTKTNIPSGIHSDTAPEDYSEAHDASTKEKMDKLREKLIQK